MPVAIDIGSKFVKILKGGINKKGNISITDCVIEHTPDGAVENGYIKNSTELMLFLRSIITKYNLTKQSCYITVRSSDIMSREIDVPAISGSKLKKVINNEIQSVFGKISDRYFDYTITDTVVVDYKNIHKVLAYSIPKDMVLSYYELINTCGLKPVAFDVHRNSVYKLLKGDILINQQPVTDKVMVFIDLGASYVDFDLIIDGSSVFKRSVPISDELDMEDDFISGFSNAYENIPDSNDYASYLNSEMGMNEYLYGSQYGGSNISPFFAKVNEELYKMLQFSISRAGGKAVTNVYLYGGNSRTQGLDQYLSNSLEVQVERIFNLSNVELTAEANISDIIAATGSLIRL